MAYTEQQLKAAAKKAMAAGDTRAAEELFQAAMAMRKDTFGAASASGNIDAMRGLLATMPPVAPIGGEAVPGAVQSPQVISDLAADIGQRRRESQSTPLGAKMLGITQGASFGFGDELGAAMVSPFVPETYGEVRDTLRGSNQAAAAANPKAYYSGQVLGSLAPGAAGYNLAAKGIGAVAPSLATGSLPSIMAAGGLSGAAQGGLSGAGMADGGDIGASAARSALLGGAVGAAAPALIAGVGEVGKRVISPFGGADPARIAMAETLESAGVPLTAGQKTGFDILRRIEAQTGRGQAIMDAQADEFTRLALKTAGTDAARATPEVLRETAKRIGSVFDDVLKGTDVVPDAKSLTEFSGAMATYRQLAPKATEVPLIGNINREMVKAFRTGTPIPAETFATWRSSLSKLTTSNDTATREAAIAALDAVDNSMAATLTAAGRAADVARLAEARGQWRNFLAIQKTASRAGEDRALGIISPSALRNEVALQGRSAYAMGKRGDIGDLARAGEAVMKPLPSVIEGGIRNVPGISTLIGAGAGSAAGGLPGMVVGAMAPVAARASTMLPLVQKYLANQAMSGRGLLALPEPLRALPGILAQQDRP